MAFKWIQTGSSDNDDEEFFIVPEHFDAAALLTNPEGPFEEIFAQAKDAKWAARIVEALNDQRAAVT